jgi:transposase
VYHWINTGQLDRELDDGPVQYAPQPPVARKIDGYRTIIEARLTEYPRLSATRLYEEIRAAGYAGGYTQVKEYVREVRPGCGAGPGGAFRDTTGRIMGSFPLFP